VFAHEIAFVVHTVLQRLYRLRSRRRIAMRRRDVAQPSFVANSANRAALRFIFEVLLASREKR
jgi:hypothetical protein